MAKYRKKPVIIEAEKYKPGMEDGWIIPTVYGLEFISKEETSFDELIEKHELVVPAIKTLEGYHQISKGDYIITGVKGEKYPCKPDIFEMTYEKVEE